jgi:hypothetical protein
LRCIAPEVPTPLRISVSLGKSERGLMRDGRPGGERSDALSGCASVGVVIEYLWRALGSFHGGGCSD